MKSEAIPENEMFTNVLIQGRPGSGHMGGPYKSDPSLAAIFGQSATIDMSSIPAGRIFVFPTGKEPMRALRRMIWPKLHGSRKQRKAGANALIRGGTPAVAKWLGQQMNIKFGPHLQKRTHSGGDHSNTQ